MADDLQDLIAERDISKIITTYPRAIDRLDKELLISLYHTDATDNHGAFQGSAQEFADFVIDYLRDVYVCTMHHVTHSNVEIKGEIAVGESYYYAYHRMEGGLEKITDFFGSEYAMRCQEASVGEHGHEFICGGRYIDVFSRRGGVWKIAKREITVEWKHFRPVTKGAAESRIEKVVAPWSRDRDDGIYSALEVLE
jgi:hypothetical protein